MKSSLPFIAHHKTWENLEAMRKTGRLPHALLFLGPEGIGKQKVACELAAKILGRVGEGHPDLMVVQPENGKIKIDTIRDIKKTLVFSPLAGTHRVVILNDAHAMNAAAANALLKSLEEPPEGTYFILITHALGWVPRTIVSRCQKILFSPLNLQEMRKVLSNQETELPQDMLPWAQGSLRKALLLEQVKDKVPAITSLLPASGTFGFDAAYGLAQAVVEAGLVPEFLQALLSSAHQYLISTPVDKRTTFEILNFSDRILAIATLLRQNINPKIHLTRLLLYFQEPQESRL